MSDHTTTLPTYPVDLWRISTLREDCTTLTVGSVDEIKVAYAETQRFDQLPVLDQTGRLCGLIDIRDARALLDNKQPLLHSDPSLNRCEIDENPPLVSLLAELSCHRAVVFRDKRRQSAMVRRDDWFALVTVSNLNRHPFRAHLYPILTELEALLAELIERHFEDPQDWLKLLAANRRIEVIGIWELAKRGNVDTSPISGCMLTDLIKVVAKSCELLGELGFKSRNNFESVYGFVPELRNQIMHVVRPLIVCQGDVAKLQSNLVQISDLTERVRKLSA